MNRYRFDEQEHLHLLDEKPLTGCSTVTKCMPKTLTWWASARAVESLGWIHHEQMIDGKKKKTPMVTRIASALPMWTSICQNPVEKYIELLDTAYKAHSVRLKEKAKAGVDLHAELETFVKAEIAGQLPSIPYPLEIQPFIDWSKENVKRFLWSEAYCYSEEMWTGGICDVGMEMNDGSYALGDFKSSPKAYLSSFTQAAGYALMIKQNGLFDKYGNGVTANFDIGTHTIDKLIIVPFGAEVFKPDVRPIGNHMEGFRAVLGEYRYLISEGEKP